MKVEYVTSTLGVGTELHISAAEYRRTNSEAGCSDRRNLLFAVRSYAQTIGDPGKIIVRHLEEASRHIKKTGTIVLATKTDGDISWCEIYAVTEGEIIPVVTSNDGSQFKINYSNKTKHQMKQKRSESEGVQDE